MLKPRTPFIVSVSLGFLGALLAAALKAIFDVTVQDFWKDTATPFLREHIGPWSATMLEWIGPYWFGVGSAFLLMFCVEMLFAWRRLNKPRPSQAGGPDESGIDWYFKRPDQSILTLSQQNDEEARIFALCFNGTNLSGAPIDFLSGYVQSLVTNRKIMLLIGAEGLLYDPEDTFGVPANAEFGLLAPLPRSEALRSGMPESRFRIEFSNFVLVVKLNGVDHTYNFEKTDIDKYFERFYFRIHRSDIPRTVAKPGAKGKALEA